MNNATCISDAEYQKNIDWASKSYGEAARSGIVTCRGCDNPFPLIKVFRCYHCGSYFCPACARNHFGSREGQMFEKQEGII
jgi:rRNA maturation endonuclease Nob1